MSPTISPQMKKMLSIVSIVFGLIFAWFIVKKLLLTFFMATYTPPPVTISAVPAVTKTWQSYLTSVGTITAINGVDISAETSGIVKEIRFESGQSVKKGDLLVLLDTSVEEAQLKDSQARAKLAQLNYDRNKVLVAKNAVTQSQIDTLLAQLDQAQAGVEQIQAKIRQKTISAPFDGKIGIRMIDIGQFVPAGTNMVTLESLDPLYVQFNLPEQYVSELYLQQPVKISVNLAGGKTIIGAINAINSKVDQTTRNILIQATIPNPDHQLYPGMYALVYVMQRERNNVITLPQTAISYSLHGDSVFVIKNEASKKCALRPFLMKSFALLLENLPLYIAYKHKEPTPVLKAYRQYVTVGERRENEVSILKGIKAGDQVVTSGQLKLQNATPVEINNSVEL
ncbi:MAG: efflux RND transporter periplasmic adaptor subunit [Gammaproteobacteria bacterium]